nr:hypothetical protein [Marinicella sp. W31]MDC2880019.1 hypothetical protein [Marinicella sp. W31]
MTGDIFTLSVGGNAGMLPADRLTNVHLPMLLQAAAEISAPMLAGCDVGKVPK